MLFIFFNAVRWLHLANYTKKTVTNWNRKCFWTSVVYILSI